MKICNDRSGQDKWLHFVVCLIISIVLAGVFSLIPIGCASAAICVFILTLGIGVAKEISDSRKADGHFCVWDLAFDALGALPGTLLACFANYYTFLP